MLLNVKFVSVLLDSLKFRTSCYWLSSVPTVIGPWTSLQRFETRAWPFHCIGLKQTSGPAVVNVERQASGLLVDACGRLKGSAAG